MNKAFLPLSRGFFEHEYYRAEKFDKWHAYFDLVSLAEYKDESKLMRVKGKELRIKRGQVANSKLALGERWKWNVKTVEKYLKLLKRDGELSYESFPKGNPGLTIFTLHNYDQICQKFTAQQPFLIESPSIIPGDFPSEISNEIPTSNNITSTTSTKKANTIEESITTSERKPFDVDAFIFGSDGSMNGSL